MEFRTYEHKKDRKAVHRIWLECGWLEQGKEESFDEFVQGQTALVADINNAPECFTVMTTGTMRYLKEDLPGAFVTGVTTSRIARKLGLAARQTAELVARAAEAGAAVASLGMFEQGFYNQLGFGTSSYEHWISFDPSKLKIRQKARIPSRLSHAESALIHRCRLNRLKHHGNCNLDGTSLTSAEMVWGENSFGLGYYDAPGKELSHHFCATASDVENGPYRIWWLAYRNYNEFEELMALIRNLGDQIKLITMREPQGIQIQDLLDKPFHYRMISQKSKYEQRMRATAYYQLRICNLQKCLEKTHLPGTAVDFNLELRDPIAGYLTDRSGWRGLSGEYRIHLGQESTVQSGSEPGLPILKCSVNAFTRMWMGVVPATGLAVTDELEAPLELKVKLDALLRLPRPSPDWDF